MAEQADTGGKKPGYFARRRAAKEARKAAEQAPPKIPTTPLRPAAPAARPAGAPPRPAPPPAPPARVSLESLPEVEKRIDRMAATERRQRLLERYESKFGEKLELPHVFVPIEDEKKAEAAAAADAMPGGPKAIDEGRLAAVTGMAPPRPSAPAPRPPAPGPAKPGLFGPKPAPQAPARPPPPAPARPAAPVEAAPAAPAPKLPEGMTMGRYMWPAIWPFWGCMVRRWAKYRYPGNSKKINLLTLADIPLLVPMFFVRLVIFWPGLAMWAWGYFKKKKAAKPAATVSEEAPATTN